MNNFMWMAIGFFVAIGLVLVFMPKLAPKLMSNNQTESKCNVSPKYIGIFLLVPIVAGLLYAKLGTPQATSVAVPSASMKDMSQPAMPVGEDSKHVMGDFSAMAAKLAAKLEKNPNDGEGWALLARSYVELKQHKDALPAFEKAMVILPDDPQLLADYVDARAMTQGHQLDEKAAELINKAIKLDPNLPKALMLAGTLAFDHADYKKAIEIWEHLHNSLKGADATPELLNEITANIASAQAVLAAKK
ncbi:MAG: tetratricopeptide repeat protein [Methylophilaceae bacterium]